MNVNCPVCGKEARFEGNPFRPFCSERCKLVDLGNWLSETYRVPDQRSDKEEEGVAKPPEDPVES